jgi:hypothetical protein
MEAGTPNFYAAFSYPLDSCRSSEESVLLAKTVVSNYQLYYGKFFMTFVGMCMCNIKNAHLIFFLSKCTSTNLSPPHSRKKDLQLF